MQNAVRVIIVLLDANRKVFVAVETRRLLKNRAQHIEMVRKQTIFLRGLIQFSQSGNIVKKAYRPLRVAADSRRWPSAC